MAENVGCAHIIFKGDLSMQTASIAGDYLIVWLRENGEFTGHCISVKSSDTDRITRAVEAFNREMAYVGDAKDRP